MASDFRVGGVIQTYQKYDPFKFPSPAAPPPDVVSPAFEHMLQYGRMRNLSEEELARAVRLDPSQFAGLGPSIDMLLALLRERKRKILAAHETRTVLNHARRAYQSAVASARPPKPRSSRFRQAAEEQDLHDLERLWLDLRDDHSPFARQLSTVIERLGEKYQVEELAAKYEFTGREALSVARALAIKEELEKIDKLIKQLEEAAKTAQIGVIDLAELAEFAEPGDLEKLEDMRKFVDDYLRELARQQGLMPENGGYQLSPQAYRLFQGKLLERIFSDLQAARTGRHQGPVVGEGAVETQQTKPYEFGDSLAHADLPQSVVNALIRGERAPNMRLLPRDLVVHPTRNSPKCATAVILDMSGSMRYDGQFVHVKRMGLALEGLIRREFPGDYLQFIEMYSFAKPRPAGEIIELLPKFPTIHNPLVALKFDMSRLDVSEHLVPPHFTNIQHALHQARRFLSAQDTPNRQVILITDGLPTAHFEGSVLHLVYPPAPATEAATLREGLLCQREGVTINIFLLPSWSQSEADVRFSQRLAESTRGRVFFTGGADLDRYVVWDYVRRRREILA